MTMPGRGRVLMTSTGIYFLQDDETLEEAKQRHKEKRIEANLLEAQEARSELADTTRIHWIKRWKLKRKISRLEQ